MVVRKVFDRVYDLMNQDPLSGLPSWGDNNRNQLYQLMETLQGGNTNRPIDQFIDGLTPVEFYKYCETLKSVFLQDLEYPFTEFEGEDGWYVSDGCKKKLKYNGDDVSIDDLFLDFIESNSLNDLWNDKRGSYFFRFLRSIGGGEKNAINIMTEKKEGYRMGVDDAKIILKSFFEFLRSQSVGFPDSTTNNIISEEQFFDKLNRDFKLNTQNVAHRHIALRLKKLQPILKIINANPKFKEILKKHNTDQHNSARKIKSRIDLDVKTYKQLTFFFEKLSNDEKLANLFYEYAMEVARNESKIRRERLKEKSRNNEIIEFEAIHVGLGINGGILSEAHRNMYPHISSGCLTIGREDYFGTNFNFGGYLKKAFTTNSRRISANANELPWPTYEGALNDGGPHAIIDETNIGSSEYADDATWGLEIFVKHFFHSNHLFNCDIISQEEDLTGNGYNVMLRDRDTNEVVFVKSKKNVFTTGLGIQKMGCKKPTKETFDMELRTEGFNPDRIYKDVLAWMKSPEYKNKQSGMPLPSFTSRFPSVPPRITIEQLLILAKYPGFPFEAFVEGARILFPGTGDSTKIALERIYLYTSSRSKKSNYIEPLSFVVGSDMNYKEELRPEIRARYAPLINKVATSDERTDNYKIIPLQGYVMSISNNGNKRYNNYDDIDRYGARVSINDQFKITQQVRNEVVFSAFGVRDISFDLMVDCSGFDGSYLSSVLKTRETGFSRKTYERIVDEGPSSKFYEEDESIISLDTIGRRGFGTAPGSIATNATDNPSELAKKRESIWKKLKYSLIKDPDFLTRFYLYDNSWFEVRYADSYKVILGCYNNKKKLFQEFSFFRNDFENIFDLKYKKDQVNFERFTNIMIQSTPIRELVGFLGIPNQYKLFDEVKEERCYENVLKKQNNLISKEAYENHKNTIINQLIKSVFNEVSKKEIQLFTRIVDACYDAGGGTVFLGPTGGITAPDFSIFEKILLDDSLGIGENTAARFRYWWRIYSYVYDNYDEKFVVDAKIASGKMKADGAELLDTGKESIFKTSFTDAKIQSQSKSKRYNTNKEVSQYVRMFQNSDYTHWDSYFFGWFSNLISIAKINPSDYGLSKTEHTQYLQKLRIFFKKDIKGDNNAFSVELNNSNKADDRLNRYLQCLLSYNLYEGKNITEYLIYLANEFGKDGVVDLHIPLIVDNGVLAFDFGGIDKKAYEDSVHQAKVDNLKRKATDVFSDGIAKVLGKPRTKKSRTTKRSLGSQVGSKLKRNSARFGFYNPGTNEKLI